MIPGFGLCGCCSMLLLGISIKSFVFVRCAMSVCVCVYFVFLKHSLRILHKILLCGVHVNMLVNAFNMLVLHNQWIPPYCNAHELHLVVLRQVFWAEHLSPPSQLTCSLRD